MSKDVSAISISWTIGGDLRVDDEVEDQPKLLVNFYEWRRFTPTEKIALLRAILDQLDEKTP